MKISNEFKEKLIYFIDDYLKEDFIVLDSCNYKKDKYSSFDFLVAFEKEEIQNSDLNSFYTFNESKKNEWKFGYLSYDLKNEIEKNLRSNNRDFTEFESINFFTVKNIFFIKDNQIIVEKTNIKELDLFIKKVEEYKPNIFVKNLVDLEARITEEIYFEGFNKIKSYIKKGDIYEINYCQEFFSRNTIVNPIKIFFELKNSNQAPFSALMKIDQKYIISASPERFLKKIGNKIISQPIKGTAKRGGNIISDFLLKKRLKNDKKEISENAMVVDLVRNDLGVIAKKGIVKVEEYSKVYTFKNIHQLISTITCKVEKTKTFKEIIEVTFPMGSMTGTPKHRAMQIIDEIEVTKRGIYSGAIGYIKPNGDFDFSVLIRTILYNCKNKYLSFTTGGAITDKSIRENEYKECFLKADTIIKAINKN